METRKIASLNVSVVGLGCNNFGSRIDAEATAAVVDAALEAGVNFFDTADVYGKGQSEESFGRSRRRRRGDALIAAKSGLEADKQRQGAKPEYIRQAVEESLRRLGTDRIDLYQLHKPDPETPIADTLGALGELMHAGKVREIGCSNFSVEQLREAAEAAGDNVHFVSVQNEFNLFHRDPERGVLPECARTSLAFVPLFSPRERTADRQILQRPQTSRRKPRSGKMGPKSLYKKNWPLSKRSSSSRNRATTPS